MKEIKYMILYLVTVPTVPVPVPVPQRWCVQYTYSHKEGGGELTREKVKGAMLHKAGRNTNRTDCNSSL